MSKKCDWCGALEPSSGTFSRTGERYNDTILCPECCPDDEVERGIFVLYSFTADDEKQDVLNAVENYLKAAHSLEKNIKLVKDVGAKAAMDGHSRYALVLELENGLSCYRIRDLIKLEAIIDSANGDPERNNARAKFYNYKVDRVLGYGAEPEVVGEIDLT